MEKQLADHDRRLVANHDSIATLRDKSAAHETGLAVATTELHETREDIGELSDRVRGLTKAFWAATGTLALVFVALCGLLLSIATSGG